MIDQIKEALEFSKQWWGSVQEGEPIAQDEIEIVKEMNGHVQYLLDELEKAQGEINRTHDQLQAEVKTTAYLRTEHTTMKETLEWYDRVSDYDLADDGGQRARIVLSTLSQPKEEQTDGRME